MYGQDSAALTGASVHNTRIERLWVPVNETTLATRDIMDELQHEGFIDVDNAASLLLAQEFFRL